MLSSFCQLQSGDFRLLPELVNNNIRRQTRALAIQCEDPELQIGHIELFLNDLSTAETLLDDARARIEQRITFLTNLHCECYTALRRLRLNPEEYERVVAGRAKRDTDLFDPLSATDDNESDAASTQQKTTELASTLASTQSIVVRNIVMDACVWLAKNNMRRLRDMLVSVLGDSFDRQCKLDSENAFERVCARAQIRNEYCNLPLFERTTIHDALFSRCYHQLRCVFNARLSLSHFNTLLGTNAIELYNLVNCYLKAGYFVDSVVDLEHKYKCKIALNLCVFTADDAYCRSMLGIDASALKAAEYDAVELVPCPFETTDAQDTENVANIMNRADGNGLLF